MSKLIDLLEKAGTQSVPILGFRSKTIENKQSDIVPIGQISETFHYKKKYFSNKIKDRSNIFLLSEKITSNISENIPKNIICGVTKKDLTKNEMNRMKNIGVDFVIFDPYQSEASILNESQIGKVAIINNSNSEEENRAIAELEVDAVYIDQSIEKSPIKFQTVIQIQKATNSIEVPAIINCENNIDTSDLETIRNLGIKGIISSVEPLKDFEKFSNTIDNLPVQKNIDKNFAAISPNLQETNPEIFDEDSDDYDDLDE